MKHLFLAILFGFLSHNIFSQTFTVSGNIYNDPDGGLLNNSAAPFSLPLEKLYVVLIESTGDTIATVAIVDSITGGFSMSGIQPGTYYARLIPPNTTLNFGDPAPVMILETHWTHTGESTNILGLADATVDGKTEPFIVAANFSNIRFGIQQRPYADNKMNLLFDKSAAIPTALTVNTGSPFTQGTGNLMSGIDSNSGQILFYSINALPNYGTLYLGPLAVTSLNDVDSLTPQELATLAYLPNGNALNQELDFFTYRCTDNANSQSNNATYVIPFQLLDSDNDTYVSREDMDDDNDGITDLNECDFNNFGNLAAAYNLGSFSFIQPSHFGYTPAYRVGLNLSADLSSLYSKPAGSIIVTISNANTHPTADQFFVNDTTGPSQWTISGTLGAYTVIEHGLEYFSYDTRTITILNATPAYFLMQQTPGNPTLPNWYSGSDGYNWWLTNNNTVPETHVDSGFLAIALTNPEPKYFQVASTSNNYQEWATYFVRILPECDADNDGVPNRLDLDSDNDGCLDALEGSHQYEYADVDSSAGMVSVGPGSLAINQNLCADISCVDTNGIPIMATSSGQNPVGTYNPAVTAIVCAMPVPIRLIEFGAKRHQNTIILNWSTASEQYNKGFSIERSMDGRSWNAIGFEGSKVENGNSNHRSEYNFTDKSPIVGQNLYRLKQIDMDGKFEYSPVRFVQFNEIPGLSIYPNPAKSSIHIMGLCGEENIILYDYVGRIILQRHALTTNTTIDIDGISDGWYYIQVIGSDNSMSTFKVLKKQ